MSYGTEIEVDGELLSWPIDCGGLVLRDIDDAIHFSEMGDPDGESMLDDVARFARKVVRGFRSSIR